MTLTRPSVLEVDSLSKQFRVRGRSDLSFLAVDDVSFSVAPGASFGIAGESGSGKTTLARMVLLLEEPSGGTIRYEGEDVVDLDREARRRRRRRVQAVFQDVGDALNPRMRVREIIAEPLLVWRERPSKSEIDDRVADTLVSVGLRPEVARRFPHQMSGGQRQRVAIARSLIVDPELIVLDEPVSALDVSVRSQVLNLLMDLQESRGLSYLIIAHDLALLRHVTDEIGIMYLGRVVESGRTEEVFAEPVHPYTKALLSSVPKPDPRLRRARPAVTGEVSTGALIPTGCRFNPRCPHALEICTEVDPSLEVVTGTDSHLAACHVFGQSEARPYQSP